MRNAHLRVGLVVALLALAAMTVGCTPQPVVLDYKVAPVTEHDTVAVNLSGQTLTVSPFADARTTNVVVDKRPLREGDNIGIWIANALQMELSQAGAKVDKLPAGERPATGKHISGRVNQVKSERYGWGPGGFIAAAIGTGYSANIDLTVDLMIDAVQVLSKEYRINKKVNANAAEVILVGGHGDVTKALQISLCELIRTQILPDIANEVK